MLLAPQVVAREERRKGVEGAVEGRRGLLRQRPAAPLREREAAALHGVVVVHDERVVVLPKQRRAGVRVGLRARVRRDVPPTDVRERRGERRPERRVAQQQPRRPLQQRRQQRAPQLEGQRRGRGPARQGLGRRVARPPRRPPVAEEDQRQKRRELARRALLIAQ